MTKRRKIFETPEERAAWEAAREARLQELYGHIERTRAELAGKLRSA